ncbi:leucine-rich repeat domain-containing protein [Clostridium formicaceticum]|uniref:Internalin-A n=1 Tax=Clostridium formicaceticum TaxID=1497 RepID=A0AAC9WFR2_9CLOT|nr:leucine-rich repeat domain-containing protein [Clostridium formicaceticum]AOY75761.1 hypothetical protein BJL90_07525 [Clostridium formicaceticum]ARE86085.1 Internalin-A precursor [Clostridium formicaceticum]
MTLCTNCGTKNEENSKFCINCGRGMEIEALKQEAVEAAEELEASQEESRDIEQSTEGKKEGGTPYIFKKLDDTEEEAKIHFRKLNDDEVFTPVDRITPIKEKMVSAYNDKVKSSKDNLDKRISKGKAFINDKATQLKETDPKKLLFLKIGVVACVLLLIFAIVGVNFYRNSEHRAFAIAEKYENKEDYEGALEAYYLILEKNPNNLLAKERIGFLYLEYLEDYWMAENYLREVALLSEDPAVQLRLSNLFPVITVSPEEDDTVYKDFITVELATTASDAVIYYSLINNSGESPFTEYYQPIVLDDGENIILAQGISTYGFESDVYTFVFHVNVDDKFVVFDNAALEEAIKGALGKSQQATLKESDIYSISSIQMLGNRIAINKDIIEAEELKEENMTAGNWNDLGDLGKLKNLKELMIYHQPSARDFQFVASLPSLENLTITATGLEDIQFLKDNQQLNYLNLSNNKIQGLNGIQDLSNLQYLDLSHNRVNDVYHISNLTALKKLYLGGNSIEDVNILRKLQELEELSVATNSNTDYEFLGSMTGLKKLDLSNPSNARVSGGDDGRDISGLSQLTSLEDLSLAGCGVKNVEALSDLQNLKYLDLSRNAINAEALKTIGKLSALETLNLEDNQIDEGLSSLTNLGSLKDLNLSSNSGIDDFDSLASYPKLESLTLKGVRLSDFSSISSLSGLRYLNLENNSLEEITFRNMPNLEYLNLAGNNISQMPDIAKLPNIKVAILKNNGITDITTLEATKGSSLLLLDLSNNRITDAAAFAAMKNLKFLNISRNNQMVNMSVFDNMGHMKVIPVNGREADIPRKLLEGNL